MFDDTSLFSGYSDQEITKWGLGESSAPKTLQIYNETMEGKEGNNAKLYTAMLNAQKAFDTVARTEEAFNYKYAPLDKVIEATRKGLSENGLVIMQFPISDEERVGVRTVVAHISGETIETEYVTSKYKPDPQGIGSLITYFRRYAYMAACGIAPEDDDAASAMTDSKAVSASKNEGAGSIHPASLPQIKAIQSIASRKGLDIDDSAKRYGVSSLTELTITQASQEITRLNEMPDMI